MISVFLERRDSFSTYEENPGVLIFNCQRLKGQESLRNGGHWEIIK